MQQLGQKSLPRKYAERNTYENFVIPSATKIVAWMTISAKKKAITCATSALIVGSFLTLDRCYERRKKYGYQPRNTHYPWVVIAAVVTEWSLFYR